MNTKKAIIYVDGAARGNPGPAAIAAIIKNKQGKPITSISQRIGMTTNNQAEYKAVIAALEKAISLGAKEVEVKSDSELVVKQINGRYRVKKAHLKPLYQQVKQLQNSLESFTITHIPRRQNSEADSLANKTLNLVASIAPAESCRLPIKSTQTSDADSDIAYLSKLINILKDFPGQDEVSLRITSEEKGVHLKLPNIRINYCPELRQRLVQLVGKKGLRIEQVT